MVDNLNLEEKLKNCLKSHDASSCIPPVCYSNEEILEIEKELANIREEIEAKQGRLQYLQSRVAMSTITIEMYTEKPQGTGTTVSYGTKMWNAIKSGFNGLSSFFLGILHVWPFILILAVVLFFIRRKLRKKNS